MSFTFTSSFPNFEVLKKANAIPITKKPKLTTIKDNDWMKSYKGELSPSQALERFYKLKTEEKKQRLLEEVRNVELLW